MPLAHEASCKWLAPRKPVRGLVRSAHPSFVHVTQTYRYNVDYTYCNECNQVSRLIPVATIVERSAESTS